MACGTEIAEGAPCVRWRPSAKTFTDWISLIPEAAHSGPSGYVCACCAPWLKNTLLTATQQCVISKHGAWLLRTDAARAWLLRSPPEPPFVVLISDAMKQHLIWRAPFTLDPALLQIQFGRRTLRIDRALLERGERAAAEAAEIAREHGLKMPSRHPFSSLDRSRADPVHGVLRTDVVRLAANQPSLAARLETLRQLGEGELWALAILSKAKTETPAATPLTLKRTVDG